MCVHIASLVGGGGNFGTCDRKKSALHCQSSVLNSAPTRWTVAKTFQHVYPNKLYSCVIIASSLSGTGILIACRRLLAPLWAHPCPIPSEGDQINKSVNLLDSAFQSKLCGVAVCFSTCSSHIPSDRIHWSSSHCIPFTCSKTHSRMWMATWWEMERQMSLYTRTRAAPVLS